MVNPRPQTLPGTGGGERQIEQSGLLPDSSCTISGGRKRSAVPGAGVETQQQPPLFSLAAVRVDHSPQFSAQSGGSSSPNKQLHLVAVVSPAKLGGGHVAYKLFKTCPLSSAAAGNHGAGRGSDSPANGLFVMLEQEGGGGDCANATCPPDRDLKDSCPLGPILPVFSAPPPRPRRRKSQLNEAAAVKRARSTMRQELSLPLLNITSCVAKENCDNITTSRALGPASLVASSSSSSSLFLELTTTETAIGPVPGRLEGGGSSVAAAAANGGPVPSRVLKDRNAEKSACPESWHRQRSKSCTAGSAAHAGRDYPLRSQSLTRRTRQGSRR